MAWLGEKLVLCTSLRYLLLQPAQGTTSQLFALAEEAPSPTLVQSIPSANLAVLLMVLFTLPMHIHIPNGVVYSSLDRVCHVCDSPTTVYRLPRNAWMCLWCSSPDLELALCNYFS